MSHHNGPAKQAAKIADKEEEKTMQKLLATDSSMGFGMSAISISLLTLAAMLGVRMRRGLQQASSDEHAADMSTAFALEASDSILELKAQDITVGWGQPSFQNTPPPTLCYASAPGKQTFDPLGLNMREAEIKHGRTLTLATLFQSDPELKTKGFKNARFAAAATAFAPLAAFG